MIASALPTMTEARDPSPSPALSTDAERARQAVVADLAAAIERAAVDIGIAEEPSGFTAALDAGAPPPDATVAPPPSSRG